MQRNKSVEALIMSQGVKGMTMSKNVLTLMQPEMKLVVARSGKTLISQSLSLMTLQKVLIKIIRMKCLMKVVTQNSIPQKN